MTDLFPVVQWHSLVIGTGPDTIYNIHKLLAESSVQSGSVFMFASNTTVCFVADSLDMAITQLNNE